MILSLEKQTCNGLITRMLIIKMANEDIVLEGAFRIELPASIS